MATQSLTPRAIPFPFIPKTETISQSEIHLLLSLRKQADKLADDIANAEKSILTRLETGSAVESGLLNAAIKITERRNVSWKSVVERKLGAAFAKRVLAATRPDVYPSLSLS